jgi:5-deoxy-glucuronate isomerase
MEQLVVAGRDSAYIGLGLARLEGGEEVALGEGGGALEATAVVLAGELEVLGGARRERVARRGTVFDTAGDAVYVPLGERTVLRALRPAEVVVVTAPAAFRCGGPRVIPAGAQQAAVVGRDSFERTVRTILGPVDEASRLLVGETLNLPGRWSSYPPHKHDRPDGEAEAALEEVYFYKVRPPGGFGVQVRYTDEGHEATVVGEGSVAVIRSGYHPVVAAPGYALYYLWVLAGEERRMAPRLDPHHAWVATGERPAADREHPVR